MQRKERRKMEGEVFEMLKQTIYAMKFEGNDLYFKGAKGVLDFFLAVEKIEVEDDDGEFFLNFKGTMYFYVNGEEYFIDDAIVQVQHMTLEGLQQYGREKDIAIIVEDKTFIKFDVIF